MLVRGACGNRSEPRPRDWHLVTRPRQPADTKFEASRWFAPDLGALVRAGRRHRFPVESPSSGGCGSQGRRRDDHSRRAIGKGRSWFEWYSFIGGARTPMARSNQVRRGRPVPGDRIPGFFIANQVSARAPCGDGDGSPASRSPAPLDLAWDGRVPRNGRGFSETRKCPGTC